MNFSSRKRKDEELAPFIEAALARKEWMRELADAEIPRFPALGRQIVASEKRYEVDQVEDAELLIVAFGSLARFARAAIRELRSEGVKVGLFRPISLWPFPSEALAEIARGKTRIACLEQNAGQMIDDVRLAVLGSVPVVPIGGISTDPAGFGIGALLDSALIGERVRAAYEGRDVPRGVVA